MSTDYDVLETTSSYIEPMIGTTPFYSPYVQIIEASDDDEE